MSLFYNKILDKFKLPSTPTPKKNENTLLKIQCQEKLDYINQLADTINTTLNEIEFECSLTEIKKKLSELIIYEKSEVFVNSPSEDLKKILENENLTREKFQERRNNSMILKKAPDSKAKTLVAAINPSVLDFLFEESGIFLIKQNKASIGLLQRYFKIGFNRASEIMDQLYKCGIVSEEVGTHPRKVLASFEDFKYLIQNYDTLYYSSFLKDENTNNEDIEIMIRAQKKLVRAKELEKIINTTTDEKEFFLSLNEITRILYDLTSYEDKISFSDSPSKDLKRITENRGKIIDSFQERVRKDFDRMSGHDFEHFCAKLLQKNGFENIEVTKGSGDQGIDIIAFKDGVKYGIQCKCYSTDIGNKAVQEVFSGSKFYDCHVPVVLTNRYFTEAAKELAQKTNVLLWDREHLKKLIKTTEI